MALNFPWIYPVRVAQVVFAIIVLGLTAYGRPPFALLCLWETGLTP